MARTGRLSSDQPNLHNIPVRSELGREFRKAFVPAEGCELLVADYNQIELRCIAHLAEDPGLIDSFESGRDIHTETASRIFGVEAADVTIELRSKAKMVSYGLAYGMEAYGLGQRLNIPTEEAAEILDAYFVAFPAVKAYMERTVAEARERGYTETLFGRRRQIPELASSNFRIRQAGERQAMNAGIQGLAADIFKVALVRLDARLAEEAADSRLILQVHDEVLLEVPPDDVQSTGDLVVEVMAGAAELLRAARGKPLGRLELGRGQGLTGRVAHGGQVQDGSDERAADRGSALAIVVLVFALYSLTMAVTTADDCGDGVDKEWNIFPPEWECNSRPGSVDGAGAARPLVRAGRRPPRRGLPPLLLHQGHRAGGRRSSSTRSGSSRGCACSTSAAGPAATPTRSAARARGRRRRHLPAVRRPGHRRRHRPARPSERADARALDLRRRVRRRHLALPGRLRPHRRARAHRSTATAPCSRAWPGRCGPADGWRCRPSRPTSRSATSRSSDTFDADAGREPRAHRGPRRGGRGGRGRPLDDLLHAPRAAAPRRRGRPRGRAPLVGHARAPTPRDAPDLDRPSSCCVARRP